MYEKLQFWESHRKVSGGAVDKNLSIALEMFFKPSSEVESQTRRKLPSGLVLITGC